MAQTIATQRGSTTLTSNNSSTATLFTQSGGLATRVIFNQLGWWFSANEPDVNVSASVIHNISGGGSFVLGYLRDPDKRRAYQFAPGATGDNPWNFGPTQTGTSTAFAMPRGATIGGSDANLPGASNASGVIVDWTNQSGLKYMMLPSNFYMGPGDSLSIKIYGERSGVGFLTANITYSFTTVTES